MKTDLHLGTTLAAAACLCLAACAAQDADSDVAGEVVIGKGPDADAGRTDDAADGFTWPGETLDKGIALDLAPQCNPGEGCFLDPCKSNGDCLSGWCVEHLGEHVCTQTCVEECPEGWDCALASGDAPDVQYICLSRLAALCRPCLADDDCEGAGGSKDVCLEYGPQGAFCGGDCGPEDACPDGYSCPEATTVSGLAVKQCVALAGECACTATATADHLSTTCQVANEQGACPGKRMCGEGGLSACDAAVPTAEQCNGQDDDCDGQTDEGTCDDGDACTKDGLCVDGSCQAAEPVSCDDANPCTDDSCSSAQGCAHTPNAAACDDKDACSVADACSNGICLPGAGLNCDDGNPCTDDSCDVLSGCMHLNNQAPCGNGNTCVDGACTCVPDCTAKECGPDGCGGTCTTVIPDCELAAGACAGAKKSADLCADGLWSACGPANYFWNNNAYEPAPEKSCDLADNDCDGLVDEELGEATCGLGICKHSVAACIDGKLQACDPVQGAVPEVCDGLDNDCDGLADESLGTQTCGTGPCFHTVEACKNGQMTPCDPMLGASPEVVDGIDNDCDGAVDEGFPVPGTIIVTELMVNPDCVGDATGEWVELYNPTGEAWDIKGWILKDNDTDKITIDPAGPLVVGPGQSVVLAASADAASNGGIKPAWVYNQAKFQLANAGDEAVLVGPGGITVDQVAYSTTLGFPSQTSGEGRSLALKPGAYDHLLNDAGDNWTQSTAPIPGGCGDKGSPGTMNP